MRNSALEYLRRQIATLLGAERAGQYDRGEREARRSGGNILGASLAPDNKQLLRDGPLEHRDNVGTKMAKVHPQGDGRVA
jgi:hypothetical protein